MNKKMYTAIFAAAMVSTFSYAQFSTNAEAQGRLSRMRQQSVLLAAVNPHCRRYALNFSKKYRKRSDKQQAEIVQVCTRGAVDGLIKGTTRPGMKPIIDAIHGASAEEAETLITIRNAYIYGHMFGLNARRHVRTGGMLDSDNRERE